MNRVKPSNEVESMYVGFCLKAAIDYQSPFAKLEMMLKRKFEEEE